MKLKTNFLSAEECESLIQFYKDNQDKILEYKGTFPLGLFEFPQFQPLLNKIDTQVRKDFKNEMYLDNSQIVKWPINSCTIDHVDNGDKCVFICYLNDDYSGGETVLIDKKRSIVPKKGNMLYFNNSKLLHRVNTVSGNDRYVLAGWYA